MTALAPVAGAFIGRSLLHTVRNVEALLMAVALPVMLMLVFTWVFGGSIDGTGRYIDYVVPGTILTCAGFGASHTAVGVALDMRAGVIDRFRTMPIPAAAVLVGHVVASVAKNLVATAVVVLVALAIGFRPVGGPAEWLAALGLIAAWILAITTLFAAIGLAAGSADAASGYGFALLFLPYLSSGFVEVSTLPAWLQPIAQHQPITPLVDAVRALLMGGDAGGSWLAALAWCAGIALVAIVWGSLLSRRRAGRR